MLTASAFSFLSPGAQRYVAIGLGKMNEGYSYGTESLFNLIHWANIQTTKCSENKEMDLVSLDDSPEPGYHTKNNQEEYALDEEGLEKQLALAFSERKASIFLEDLFEKSQKLAGLMLTYESQSTEPTIQFREICSNDSPKPRYQAKNNEEKTTLDRKELIDVTELRASRIPQNLSFIESLSRKRSRFMLTDESQSTEPQAQRRKISLS